MVGIGERDPLLTNYMATRGKTATLAKEPPDTATPEPVKLTVDIREFVIQDSAQISDASSTIPPTEPKIDVQKLSSHVLGEVEKVQRLRTGLAASSLPPVEIQIGDKTITIPASFLTKDRLIGALERGLKGLPPDHQEQVAPLQALAAPLVKELKGSSPPPANIDEFMEKLQQIQDPKEFDKYAKGFLEGKLGLKSIDAGFIATYLFDALKGDSISKQIRGLGFVMVRAHEVTSRSPELKALLDKTLAKVSPHVPPSLKPVFEKMFTQKGPSLGHIQNLYTVVNAEKDIDKVLNDPKKSDVEKMQAYSKVLYATYELVHYFGSDVKGLLPPRMQQTIERMEFILGDKFRDHVGKAVKDWLPQGANSEFAIAMFKFASSDATARIAATLDLVKLTGLKLFGDGGKFASLMSVIKVDIDTTIYVRQLLDPASPPELKAKAFKSIADIYKLRLDKLAERFSPDALPPKIVADAAKITSGAAHSGMVKGLMSQFSNLTEEAAADVAGRLSVKGFEHPEDMIQILQSLDIDLAGKSGPELTALMDKALAVVEQANKFGAIAPAEILRTLEATGAKSAESLLTKLEGRAGKAAALAKELAFSPEAEKALLKLVQNGQMSDEALETLLKLSRDLGPAVMEKSLQALADMRPSVAARLFEHGKIASSLIKNLAKLVPELEKLGVKAAVLAPKLAEAMVKAVPAIGVVTAAGDMIRTKTIAIKGEWQEIGGAQKTTTYNDNARRFAAIAATMNTYDTALGLAEFIPGAAVASMLPQVGLALGEVTMDVLMDYYNSHPLPDNLKVKLEVAAYAAAIVGLDPVTTVALLKMKGAAKDAFLQALQEAVQQGKITLQQAETYLTEVAAQVEDKDITALLKGGLRVDRLIENNADAWVKKADELIDGAKKLGSMSKDEALKWISQAETQIDQLRTLLKDATDPTLKALAERLSQIYETTSKATTELGAKLGTAVSEQLTALSTRVRTTLGNLASKATEAGKVAQRLLGEAETRLKPFTDVAQKTVTEMADTLKTKGDALLKELENLADAGKEVLLEKGQQYLEELQALIAKYGDKAQPLLDQLALFYQRTTEIMGRMAGSGREVLAKISTQASAVLENIGKTAGPLATQAAEQLSKVRALFQIVVKDPGMIAAVATKLGLSEESLQTLSKVVGHLEGDELKAALKVFEELGSKQADQVLKVLHHLPDVALKQALKIPGLIKGVTGLLEGLEKAGMKVIDYAQVGAKLLKGIQKAIPALGVIAAAVDTVRTKTIANTGEWQDLTGNKTVTHYNDDARRFAAIGATLNTYDTALGVLEFVPGVAAASLAPQLGLALGEVAMDLLMDHYNTHPLPDNLKAKLEVAAYAAAIAGLDPVTTVTLLKMDGAAKEAFLQAVQEAVQQGKITLGQAEAYLTEVASHVQDKDITEVLKGGLKLDKLIQQNADAWLKKTDELLDAAQKLGTMSKDQALEWISKAGGQIDALKEVLKNATDPVLKALAERLDSLSEAASKAATDLGTRFGKAVGDPLAALASRVKGVGTSIASRAAELGKVVQQAVVDKADDWLKKSDELLDAAKKLGTMSKDQVLEWASKAGHQIDELTQLLKNATDPVLKALSERLSKLSEAASKAVTDLGSRLGSAVSEQLTSLAGRASQLGTDLASRVADLGKAAQKVVVDKADDWLKKSDELLETAKKLGTMSKDQVLEWASKAGHQIDELAELLKNTADPKLKALAERLGQLYETASKAAGELTSRLGSAVGDQLAALGSRARGALADLASHATDAGRLAQKLLGEVDSRLAPIAETVVKTVQNVAATVEKRGQALLKDLKSAVDAGKGHLDDLLVKGEKYLADLEELIAKYGDDAKPLLDKLADFYKRSGEMMENMGGAGRELLSKLNKRAGDAIEVISKRGGAIAAQAAEQLSKLRSLFQTVVKNPGLLAELATKMGLSDEALQTLGKVVGHLDGDELKAALKMFEDLGPKNADKVLKLMGYLPGAALKQAMKIPGMLKGMAALLDGLERAGMKVIDFASLGPKLAKGLQKAIPAFGALMAGYDTVRTTAIYTTGEWTELLSGKTIKYNEDARALAYIASKLNAVDTALGVAEFIPGVGAVSAFPQIMLAIGETALDYMMDHYNEPQNTMSPEMRNYVEAAAIGVAVATCDPLGMAILYQNSGKMAEKSGVVLAQMFKEGKHSPEKIEQFIAELSKSWTSNDNATRALFQELAAQGISLESLMKKSPPPLTQKALQMLFDNLDSATVGAETTDYAQMRQLAMAGNTSTKAYIIRKLMDQQTSPEEETVIHDILAQVSDKGFVKLMERLPAGEVAKELENSAQQAGVLKRITQLGTPQQFKDFTSQMKTDPLKAAIEGGLKLSDQQRLALFQRFADAGDFAMVDTLMNGSHGLIRIQDPVILQKMSGYLASHINTFMSTLGSPDQAGQVAAWLMAYGNQKQIDSVFQHVQADEWFGSGSDVIRKAMDFADKQGASLNGKLSPETLKAMVGTLNSGWTKAFRVVGGGSHQANEKYLYRLAQMANTDGKAMILQDLMTGWTPGTSETIVQNILLETTDKQQFTDLVNRLGPDNLSRELENRQELGRVMAAMLTRYQGDLGGLMQKVMGQWSTMSIQSDDILHTMLKRLERDRQLDTLKQLPKTVLDTMIDFTDDAFRDGNAVNLDPESKWSIEQLQAARNSSGRV